MARITQKQALDTARHLIEEALDTYRGDMNFMPMFVETYVNDRMPNRYSIKFEITKRDEKNLTTRFTLLKELRPEIFTVTTDLEKEKWLHDRRKVDGSH